MNIKNRISRFFTIPLIAAAVLALHSCSSDDDKGIIPGNAMTDFVTIESRSNSGMVFTLRQSQETPEITLHSTAVIPESEDTQIGNRVVITYTPLSLMPYTSGDIDLYGYIKCYNGTPRTATSEEIKSYPLNTPTVTQLWASGPYINIVGRVNAYEKPKRLELVMDPTTAGDTYPRLFIVHSPLMDDEPHWIVLYASIDLSPVWVNSAAKGVKVCYESPSGPVEKIIGKFNIAEN